MAEHLRGEYAAMWNATHTGVLVGQRYREAVDAILGWLDALDARPAGLE